MSKTKKVISVVLALALVMAMATVAMISASAATTVYFENSEGWAEVYAYVWGGAGGEELGSWPGSPATLVEGNVWSADIPDDCTNVIFTAGSNGPQTNNLVNQGGGYIAKLGEGTETGEYGETKTIYVWEEYTDAPTETTTEAAPVETTTEAAPVETTVAAPVETTVAAPVETTVATEPVETTVAATEDEEPTTVATEDEEPTTAVVEPTTAVVEPTETTVVEPTTAVVEPTTAVVEPTTVVVEPTTAAQAEAIVVGGVEYEAQVGDIITYTANLTTPNAIENIQAYTTYDSAKLKLVSDATTMFPNMLGVVANPQDGVIYFNASEITKGFDFTAGQTLITLQFEVIDNTYSEITTVIEEMVEFFGGDYVTGGEIVADGVVLAETLDVPEVITTTTEAEEATTTVVAPTDATSATEDEKKPATDVVPTGVAATIYVVLAVLAMAAAAVVVLRKKVNG